MLPGLKTVLDITMVNPVTGTNADQLNNLPFDRKPIHADNHAQTELALPDLELASPYWPYWNGCVH